MEKHRSESIHHTNLYALPYGNKALIDPVVGPVHERVSID